MTKRAAIYARQSEDVSEGIDRQVDRCQQLARAKGFEVVAEFRDNDTSAFKPRGPGTEWARLLTTLTAGDADLVIAVDLDRLLRSPRDLVTLTATGGKLLTVDGEIDLTTADGEFRASMLASLAQFEVRRKSERQRRANLDRREKGRPVPGRRRYGYESDGVTPREEEAAIVRRLFEHVAAGGSIRSITRALHSEGVSAGTGGKRRPRLTDGSRAPQEAPVWTTGKVRYILTNPTYGGSVLVDGALVPSSVVPGLVDPDLAVEVRAILADDARRTTPGPKPRHLASGVSFCGLCGGPILSLAGAYRCRDDSSHPSIVKPKLDEVIRREVARAFVASLDGAGGIPDETLAPLVEALARNEAAAVATAADRDDDLLSPAAARARLLTLREERRALQARVDALRVERSASSALGDSARELLDAMPQTFALRDYWRIVGEVAERFAALDIDRQRDTARALLTVTVNPGRDPSRVVVWHNVATSLNPDAPEDFDAA